MMELKIIHQYDGSVIRPSASQSRELRADPKIEKLLNIIT